MSNALALQFSELRSRGGFRLTTLAASIATCVAVIVFVTLGAMCLCSQRRVALSDTSASINQMRYRFQMLGIDTTSNSTFVIQFQSCGNWPDQQFIQDAMNPSHFVADLTAWYNYPACEINLAVSLRETPKPKPASRYRLRGDLIENSVKQVTLKSSHCDSSMNRIGQSRASASTFSRLESHCITEGA